MFQKLQFFSRRRVFSRTYQNIYQEQIPDYCVCAVRSDSPADWLLLLLGIAD
jgi:hypothetical protein